jgi:hypothetical protein
MHVTTPTSEGQGPGRVFRLAPEYRRCGVYLVLFCLLLAGLLVALKFADLTPRTWAKLVVGDLTLLAAPLLGLAVLTWRCALRVDDRGIWRRRLVGWDLWPWEAFATGAVRTGASKDSWVYPARPWHHRHLFLELLTEADRDALAERVRQVWRPALLPVPEEIEVRYGVGDRLVLSRRGITLRRRGSDPERFYGWHEVVQLRVTRVDHTRRDFRTLELELPQAGRPVRLRSQLGGRVWGGPDAEVLLAYLQQHVPADRVQVTALTGPPQTRGEADCRLVDLERADRELRNARRAAGALLLALCALLAFSILTGPHGDPLAWDWLRWLTAGAGVLAVALQGVVCWAVFATRRRRVQVLRSELMSWAAGRPGPPR